MLNKIKTKLFFLLAIIGVGCITPSLNAWRGRWGGGYGWGGRRWGVGLGYRRPYGYWGGYYGRPYYYDDYAPSRTVVVEKSTTTKETTVKNDTKQTLYVESNQESRNVAPGERIVIRGRRVAIEGDNGTLPQRDYGSSVQVTEDTQGRLQAR
ncbi:MAG TPA: hypothetical protein VGT41_06895 [Candidatus Babeliales bacterium]|nr:hypothetical protein [Candidatus Babeliales bacterium]